MTELDNDHKVKISTILDSKGGDVYSISPESSLKQMADEMLAKKIGSLVVTEKDGSLAGIISERDFLNIVGRHSKDWEDISVSDVMTKEVITANPEDTLEQVMSVMTQHHIRHIPVMGNNKIVGLLALGDIINALLDKSLFQNELLKRYIKDWPKEGQ
ncbi:MAG: CBS domain-containing protein [Pseudomonadota bacterium]|nr:CBS domain-containing protein [Pseudomonadota bacterium]